jgi:hypothetical protein
MTPNIIKAGISIRSDLLRIARRWKLSEFYKSLLSNSDPCYIELGQLAVLKGTVSNASVDLVTLTGVVQRCRFIKHNSISFADWSMLTLPDDYQIYAAQFAHAYLEIWSTLSREHSVGMPVEKAVKGQLVSLMSGKKIAAYGVLADQPSMVSVHVGDTTKKLKLTSKTRNFSWLDQSFLDLYRL